MASKNFYKIDTDDKLFVKCDGTTTAFVDSASPAKTITANGNATKLPIKFNKSAGFFNGTSDYVVVPDSADWTVGTGDYNIELFVNFSAANSNDYLLSIGDTSNVNLGLRYDGSGSLIVYQNTAERITATWTPTVNTWYHLRVRRVSGTTTLYIDGVSSGTPYSGSDNIATTTIFRIGIASDSITGPFGGWMKEFRFIKGASTTVTVPTAQYTTASEANTVLLMHFDTPATSPLASAISFDGAGDYLSLADSDDWVAGTNFTAECFFKFDTVTNCTFLGQYVGGSVAGWNFGYFAGTFGYSLYYDGVNNVAAGYTLTPSAGTWYHFAAVKDANTLRIFINGKEGAAGDFTGKTAYNAAVALTIGSFNGVSLANGSMREIRISNVARYTTAFTPSQNGFTVDANTVLYIKGNEDNGVTTFVDSSTSPKTVTTAGDTKIKYTEDYRSCIFKDETGKFPYPVGSAKVDFFAIGGGVGYFDGTNSYITSTSDDFILTPEVWSVEGYLRLNSLAGLGCLYGSTADHIFLLAQNTDGHILAYLSSNGSTWDITNPTSFNSVLKINTWYHYAFVFNGINYTLYLNGVSDGVVASGQGIFGTNTVKIGSFVNAYYLNGLLDNIRISKGVARYTATFNPPEFKKGGNQIMWVI